MSSALASRKVRFVRLLWLLELLLVTLAVVFAARLRFLHDPVDYQLFLDTPLKALAVGVVITTAMAAFGLYQVHMRHNRTEFALRLVLSFTFGGIALLVLYYLVPPVFVGRSILAMALVSGFVMVVLLRWATRGIFAAEAFKRRVLVYGAGRSADLINSRFRRRADRQSFVVVGFVPVAGQAEVVPESARVAAGSGLVELARSLRVDEVVVALDERRGCLPIDEILGCAQRGIAVSHLSSFFEREGGMVNVAVADPSWLAFSGGFDHSTPRRLVKRFFDLGAACALLLCAWPVMLVVAACVWLESGGPVLYRQTRVGENGRCFELVKFRSMRTDAEGDGVARWAQRSDDRVTRVGRIMRVSRLDELPQLFNVLRGDMSFVGPRPERPQFVDMLNAAVRFYDVRHSVKPGLTGWAQLRYPYGASVLDSEQKLTFDLYYVKNQGLVFDLMILLQTVEVVLFRRGAR